MQSPARWTLVFVLAGLFAYLAAHWLNRPDYWRPAVIPASAQAASVDVNLPPGSSWEISLEVHRSLARNAARPIAEPAPQSLVTGRWAVDCGERRIGSGGVSDYIRIRKVQSWRGELFRILARVPFGVDETRYETFGLGGHFLAERVVGSFDTGAAAGNDCSFSWSGELARVDARVSLRQARTAWESHFRRYSFLLIAAPVFILLGLLSACFAVLSGRRRRQDRSPARH